MLCVLCALRSYCLVPIMTAGTHIVQKHTYSFIEWHYAIRMSRDSSVGITTGYGLDGSGIESRWGEIFHTRPDRQWGPPSLLYSRHLASFWLMVLITHPL